MRKEGNLTSPQVITVAKRIVRAAAELGLDEAGTRICGSLWPQVKKVMQPVMSELERRYPKMLLADTDGLHDAAKAVRALERIRLFN